MPATHLAVAGENCRHSSRQINCLGKDLMLPDTENSPARGLEFRSLPYVPELVLHEFLRPEIDPRTWAYVVVWASMPKAAVDEHSNLRSGEHEVSCPASSW